MVVSRFPQMFTPAEVLYRLMNANSADAGVVIGALSETALGTLMEGLERVNFDVSGSRGFADRSKAGVVQDAARVGMSHLVRSMLGSMLWVTMPSTCCAPGCSAWR